MTATGLETPLTATNTKIDNVSRPHETDLRQLWTCSSCHLSFDTGDAQRKHMKCSWHVYNLKRRIISLPPIPLSIFEDQIQAISEPHNRTLKNNHTKMATTELILSQQCLFCPRTFEDSTDGLNNVVEHMHTAHGLFIPDQAMLSDLTSLLGYLAKQVRIWHECLYCGITRTSTLAIQDHMKDSGHCMMNFEREPELSGFWEEKSDAEGDAVKPKRTVGQGSGIASGIPVALNSSPRPRSRKTRLKNACLALPTGPETSQTPKPSRHKNCHHLARRDEMGMRYLSSQQRNTLMLATKRSQKDEAMAIRTKEWTSARKANDQKHDQANGPLSWAKGGMHNLLPR